MLPFGQSQEATMGLLARTEMASEVFTLVAPTGSDIAYLVNNCGHLVHRWNFPNKGCFGTYLRDDGKLVRVESVDAAFPAGGGAGRLTIYDWDSNVVWSQAFTEDDKFSIHHDIALLPNGNILVMIWEKVSEQNAILAGRVSSTVSSQGIWAEVIHEIKPIGTDESEIVWQWRVMDHLVQDVSPGSNNFGVIKERPGKIDFNLKSNDSADYFHFNGIDYHPKSDLILVSARNFSEVFILDHSTTTGEAAGSVGGNFGKGGDLLYRTGNPQVYHHGTANDQVFFGQHDARWLLGDNESDLTFSIYNNGAGRPDGIYSTVEETIPKFDMVSGAFELDIDAGFVNERQEIVIDGSQFTSFFSSRMSGAYKLNNSNYMVCHGSSGTLMEVDSNLEIHWVYVNPANAVGIGTQGGNPGPNSVFKVQSFESSYSGFGGRDLVGFEPLELEPIDYNCTATSVKEEITHNLKYNSIWTEDFYLQSNEPLNAVSIFTIHGELITTNVVMSQQTEALISVAHLPQGMYVVRVNNQTLKCVKH